MTIECWSLPNESSVGPKCWPRKSSVRIFAHAEGHGSAVGAEFYGPDGMYPFAGHECARAFALISTDTADCNDNLEVRCPAPSLVRPCLCVPRVGSALMLRAQMIGTPLSWHQEPGSMAWASC